MERPKISIITINYNNLKGLKRTVGSILGQTWREFEYIIIDGGSNDGSREFIEEVSGDLNYWVSEPDNGIYNAMNKGIRVASGEYLIFMNSGDHFIDNLVLLQSNKFIAKDDIICFNIEVLKENQLSIKKAPKELSFSFFQTDTISHQSTFIRANLFEKYGLYDEGLKIVSDWKYFLLLFFKFNSSYSKVEITLSRHYLDGLSADPANWELILAEREKVLQEEFPRFLKEYYELRKIRNFIMKLKQSKRIKLLQKIRFLPEY